MPSNAPHVALLPRTSPGNPLQGTPEQPGTPLSPSGHPIPGPPDTPQGREEVTRMRLEITAMEQRLAAAAGHPIGTGLPPPPAMGGAGTVEGGGLAVRARDWSVR